MADYDLLSGLNKEVTQVAILNKIDDLEGYVISIASDVSEIQTSNSILYGEDTIAPGGISDIITFISNDLTRIQKLQFTAETNCKLTISINMQKIRTIILNRHQPNIEIDLGMNLSPGQILKASVLSTGPELANFYATLTYK